jgi:hypothetical protein
VINRADLLTGIGIADKKSYATFIMLRTIYDLNQAVDMLPEVAVIVGIHKDGIAYRTGSLDSLQHPVAGLFIGIIRPVEGGNIAVRYQGITGRIVNIHLA